MVPSFLICFFEEELAENDYLSLNTNSYGGFKICTTMMKAMSTRLKLKNFYSLNQSVLLHLLSKILAFLAFMAFKGLKRPKKAENVFLPNNLELSNLARNQIKKFSPAKFFSTFVTLVLDRR